MRGGAVNSSSSEQLAHSSYEASLRNIASSDALRSSSSASSTALGPVQEPPQHRLPMGEFSGRPPLHAEAQQQPSQMYPQQQQQQQPLDAEQPGRRSLDSSGGIPHVYSNERLHQGLGAIFHHIPWFTLAAQILSAVSVILRTVHDPLAQVNQAAVVLRRATPHRHGQASAWVERGARQAGGGGPCRPQLEQLGDGPWRDAGRGLWRAGRPPQAQDGQRHRGRHLQRGGGHRDGRGAPEQQLRAR